MTEQKKARKMTRREMLRLTGMTGAGLLAAACTTVVPQTQVVESVVTATPSAGGPEVTGALWVLQKKDFFPSYNDYMREEMMAFAQENDWPSDVSYIAGFTGGTPEIQKIVASVEAGNPPDLIMHNLNAAELRNLYALDPVNDLVEEIESMWGKATPRMYVDYNFEGQWWAVPFHQRSDGGWYRKDVWDESDYDIQSLRTYPELLEACREVSRPDEEIFGWGVTINRSGDGNWFLDRVVVGWGAHYQDESGQYITVNTPEMVEAITWITDIYSSPDWERALPPGVLSWTDSTNNEAYLGGRLAYTQNGGTVYGKAILDGNPIADVTGFHPPAGGPVMPEFNSLSANNWMLLRGARNPLAAKELVRHFMLDLEKLDEVLAAAPAFALPCYLDWWEESTYIPTNEVAQQQKPPSIDPLGIQPLIYPGPNTAAIVAAADQSGIKNDMLNAVLSGTPVAEAVEDAHNRMVQVFQEFGLPGEEA